MREINSIMGVSTGLPYLHEEEAEEYGYLQEANRQFFHPLGLSLMRDGEDNLYIIDSRDDMEGLTFKEIEVGKMNRVRTELMVRAGYRLEALGYIAQPGDENGSN